MTSLGEWLKKQPLLRRQRPERRTAPGLAAYHSTGSVPKQAGVRDISSTGVYLVTRDRWSPDEVVTLWLQRHGPPEKSSERRFAVKARTVRWDENGVGLSFVLPSGMDVRLWESEKKGVRDPVEPDDILRKFRKARAFAFLSRISPEATEGVAQFLRKGKSDFRLLSAVEIALRAEEMLARLPNAEKMRADPQLVVRILEDGSWAEVDRFQLFWACLLVSSCSVDGGDQSNLHLVHLLSQLTPIHARILGIVCSKAAESAWEFERTERTDSRPPGCSVQEIISKTDAREQIRVDMDLGYLANLNLVTKKEKSSRLSTVEVAYVTPTRLGLELYARCRGHRGPIKGFYALNSIASAVLADQK